MNKYLKKAIELAQQGIRNKDGGPFGAVIVYKNKIVGEGHNTVLRDNDPTSHAEINAIRDASRHLKRFNLSGCSIYISAEPCPMCLSAIAWARIKNVYYGCNHLDSQSIGFDDHQIYNLFVNPKNSKIKIKLKQIEKQACLKLFKEYKSTTHKLY